MKNLVNILGRHYTKVKNHWYRPHFLKPFVIQLVRAEVNAALKYFTKLVLVILIPFLLLLPITFFQLAFKGLNIETSHGCMICVLFGGRQYNIISWLAQNSANSRLKLLL
jgi:hypothetical protein